MLAKLSRLPYQEMVKRRGWVLRLNRTLTTLQNWMTRWPAVTTSSLAGTIRVSGRSRTTKLAVSKGGP